jgi:hypothetical protein
MRGCSIPSATPSGARRPGSAHTESLPGTPTPAAVRSPPALARGGVPGVGCGDVRLLNEREGSASRGTTRSPRQLDSALAPLDRASQGRFHLHATSLQPFPQREVDLHRKRQAFSRLHSSHGFHQFSRDTKRCMFLRAHGCINNVIRRIPGRCQAADPSCSRRDSRSPRVTVADRLTSAGGPQLRESGYAVQAFSSHDRTRSLTGIDVSVSNSLSGRHRELDQVPAVRDPAHIVQLSTSHRVSAGEGQRRVAIE